MNVRKRHELHVGAVGDDNDPDALYAVCSAQASVRPTELWVDGISTQLLERRTLVVGETICEKLPKTATEESAVAIWGIVYDDRNTPMGHTGLGARIVRGSGPTKSNGVRIEPGAGYVLLFRSRVPDATIKHIAMHAKPYCEMCWGDGTVGRPTHVIECPLCKGARDHRGHERIDVYVADIKIGLRSQLITPDPLPLASFMQHEMDSDPVIIGHLISVELHNRSKLPVEITGCVVIEEREPAIPAAPPDGTPPTEQPN